MKKELGWKLIGIIMAGTGGLLLAKGTARPMDIFLIIAGYMIAFGGKLLGERGQDWLD